MKILTIDVEFEIEDIREVLWQLYQIRNHNYDLNFKGKEALIRLLNDEKLLSLLRHAINRNHSPSPRSCTPCEEIQKLMESPNSV